MFCASKAKKTTFCKLLRFYTIFKGKLCERWRREHIFWGIFLANSIWRHHFQIPGGCKCRRPWIKTVLLVAASAFDDYLKKNNNFQLQISPSIDGKTARTCIFQCYIGGRPLLSGFLRKIALPIPGTWVFVLVQKAECIRIRFCFEFSNSLFLLEKMVES